MTFGELPYETQHQPMSQCVTMGMGSDRFIGNADPKTFTYFLTNPW